MDEQSQLIDTEELPPDHRSGFVALVGKPNVGKSTLLNAWMGVKLAPVSPKPQTTRSRLLGILTRPDAQLIFVDTPGIHKPRTKLGDYMVTTAKKAIPDADVILFLVDLSTPPTDEDRQVARIIAAHKRIPAILAMNKADLLGADRLRRRRAEYEALGTFEDVFCISALYGQGLDELLARILSLLPLGPRYYPEEQISDQPERIIAADLIREQVLIHLRQEVPHAVAVTVQEFTERPNGMLYISAYIYTERPTQKAIVIGRGGTMLKKIGQDARMALEAFFERRVYLELWVKVRKNWRKDEYSLREFGYA